MNLEKNTEQNWKPGGTPPLASGMTALQMLKQVTYSGPRRLNASEIELLRKSKKEISDRVQHLIVMNR